MHVPPVGAEGTARPRWSPRDSALGGLGGRIRSAAEALGAAGGLRGRVLLAYAALIVAVSIAVPLVIGAVLSVRLDVRVHNALEQEALEISRLLDAGRDTLTGERLTSTRATLDAFIARNVPDNEEGVVAFLRGRPYRADFAHFPLAGVPPEVLAAGERASLPGRDPPQGHWNFETVRGEAHAQVVPVGERGALAVSILPAGELAEIGELQRYGVIGTLLVLLVASAVAFLVVGRLLRPVGELTETARSISRSDLSARIEPRGEGEAAEMARSFNAMLDRLEEVFRDQRDFVAAAGHELRDPLTICRGHLELLGDDPEDRERTKALVIDELQRMARIVDDLQVLADAEQPDFVRRERVDLRELTEELGTKVGALGRRRWQLDAAAEGTVLADRQRLTEAVVNLAHNAVQHTGERDTIAIGSARQNGDVRLWVRDTGCGVAVADRDWIFNRFARGEDAHLRYRGGGLGLAIVSAIAAAHGGRVELASRPGHGSRFTLVLPGDQPSRGGERWGGS